MSVRPLRDAQELTVFARVRIVRVNGRKMRVNQDSAGACGEAALMAGWLSMMLAETKKPG